MLRFHQVSGLIFTLVSLAQLVRAIQALPAQVGTFQIPVWCSWVAFVISGAMAFWAFKSAPRMQPK